MSRFSTDSIVGIIGAGAMGSGIAQVAAMAGHNVVVYDTNAVALGNSKDKLEKILNRLVEKGKIESVESITSKIIYAANLSALEDCSLIIEAIIENLDIKKKVFADVEAIVSDDCVIATNTSSLSVTSIAAACNKAERVLGLHFFNPAPLMALVEVVPAVQSDDAIVQECKALMSSWKKVPVIAKDTPGFIVNRVARPFYGEAIRMMEEGIADAATIDWAMTEAGGFRMGPFTLTDYIGHDVNYVVTETVFESFFYDPRYKPSFSQKRLLEAGWLGRKTGRGFFNYAEGAAQPEPNKDTVLANNIVARVVVMLINEAVDALHLNIASAEDLELAMTKGVNYPKGLLVWCDEWGADKVLNILDGLYNEYHEDRYRASALLRKAAANGSKFMS